MPNPLDPNDALKRRAASFLGQFVVLYPAINVVATYPLNAITFGDALMATYREKCGAWEDRPSDLPPSLLFADFPSARLAALLIRRSLARVPGSSKAGRR